MPSVFSQVVEFNQQVLGVAPRYKGLQNKDEALLSYTQLKEEAQEFLEAIETGDYIGCVDSCIDSIYFALGILYKLGVTEENFDDIFEVVHTANMSKKLGKAKGREEFGSADASKPQNWVSPEETIRRILLDD